MHTDGKVLMLQLSECRVVSLELLEVARDITYVVVLVADAIQRQVDDDLGIWAALANVTHFAGNDVVHQTIRRDVDDARPTVPVK